MGTNWSRVGSAQQDQGSFKYGTPIVTPGIGRFLSSMCRSGARFAARQIFSKIAARLSF
jgi:hypothetical protein